MLVPSDKQAKSNLEKLVELHNELKLQVRSLMAINSELGFWGSSLSTNSAKEHDKLIGSIDEYLQSLHYLHNCLMNIYINKSGDNTIDQWKTKFIEANKFTFELFKSRKTKSMNTVFSR